MIIGRRKYHTRLSGDQLFEIETQVRITVSSLDGCDWLWCAIAPVKLR